MYFHCNTLPQNIVLTYTDCPSHTLNMTTKYCVKLKLRAVRVFSFEIGNSPEGILQDIITIQIYREILNCKNLITSVFRTC